MNIYVDDNSGPVAKATNYSVADFEYMLSRCQNLLSEEDFYLVESLVSGLMVEIYNSRIVESDDAIRR